MTLTIRRTTRDTLILAEWITPMTPGARVTSQRGQWGFWTNGHRFGPYESREAAETTAEAHVLDRARQEAPRG